ncbi:MAG TPA: hypothetical protein DCY13_02760 [Verrucomicrobiales bacterium]|nr:hypothetical protein [Verrucomicrobiales bacterium]
MKDFTLGRRPVIWVALLLAGAGCGDPAHDHSHTGHHTHGHGHVHVAPHGGTLVALGDEAYHLELVRDAEAGTLTAWVLDGHLENFVRIESPALQLVAEVNEISHPLKLSAVVSQATGETIGDTSMFAGQADWLKTAERFRATLDAIAIRTTTYSNVTFPFPEGNE